MESVVWGRGHENFARPLDEVAGGADAVLLLENYDSGWVPDLARLRALRVFWSIDSHVMLAAHARTCRQPMSWKRSGCCSTTAAGAVPGTICSRTQQSRS